MAPISHLTSQQLRRAADLKEKIKSIQGELEDLLLQGPEKPWPPVVRKKSFWPVSKKLKSNLSNTGKTKIIVARNLRRATIKTAHKKTGK